MGTLRTSIILDLSGNLQARARQLTGSLQRLGQRGSASMRLLDRGVSAAGRGLGMLANRYTALITGGAAVGAIRMIGNLEERFTRLGIQANRSAEEIDALKRKIFETALAPDIQVDPGRITSAIEEIIEKTGDLKFAEANIRNIGLALQATGADGAAIGGILAEFQKMGMGAKEAFEALDILTVQGKEGAFTLQNLAALGPRVVTAYTAMGRTGVPAIREMGAALQVIRQGTGSAEQAATAFEALLRVMGDRTKIQFLQRSGIQVFDVEALKEGREMLRPINELMVEIVQRTQGKKTLLSDVFDAEAMRAFNAAAAEFQRSGHIESLDKFYNVHADGSTLTLDAARAASNFNASLASLSSTWQKFADRELTEPVKQFTEYLNGLEPGTVERWMSVAASAAKIAGALIIAKKVGLFGLLGKPAVRQIGQLAAAYGATVAVNPAMLPLAGAATAAGVSERVAKGISENQVSGLTTTTLKDMLNRQSVMGGGAENYQSRLIREELDRRDISASLKISIDAEGRAKVREMRSGKNLDLDVDSGLLMRSH